MQATMLRLILLPLIVLGYLSASQAQQPALFPSPLPAASTPSDPLKRETPRSTTLGFIEAAHAENYQLAARYFQTTAKRTPRKHDEELAQQLMTIMDRKFIGNLYSISNDPEGELNDGLLPNLEKAGEIKIGKKRVDLILVQMPSTEAGKIWLISSETLQHIPDIYKLIQFSEFEKRLPKVLVKYHLLTMPLWQWVAVILLYPVALGAAWFIMLLLRLLFRLVARLRGKTTERRFSLTAISPVTLLFMLFLHYLLVNMLGAPIMYRQYYTQFVIVLAAIVIFWLFLRATDFLAEGIGVRLERAGQMAARSLLMLGRRVFKALLFIVMVLFVLRSSGVDVSAVLAGIGIGGLVLGFGAQKTIENLFGGISLLTDRVLHVGDFCKVGDQLGTVEDIGLRSTRIRRVDRTLVSIPNGSVATASLENYSKRDKILFKSMIGLRYETSADQLRYLLAEIRQLLYQHSKVESSTARVRLVQFGASSIDLEAFAYIFSTDYPEYLAIREDVLLRIMGLVEKSGTSFAFPAQTVYLGRDKGLDPEKSKAAETVVQGWRENNQLPFPDHDPDVIAQLENTLEYPPPASVLRKEK